MVRSFNCLIYIVLSLIPGMIFAEPASGIGGLAANLMEPVGILSDVVSSVSLVLGVMFLFATVVKYLQHRISPLAVPISTVVFLFVCGIVLVLLPIAYKIVYTTPPYHVEHKE